MMGASTPCLTVRHGQAYSLHRHLLNEMAGIGVPSVGGIIGRFNAAFLCLRSAQWRAGEGGRNSRRAHAVRQPEPDRHPIGVGRRESTRREQTIMITSPKGNTPSVRPVSLETLEKRVRRALAPRACALLKTRPGTPDRNELGLYAVVNHKRVCIEKNANLQALARYLGAMEDHEALATDAPERWSFIGIDLVNGMAVKTRHYFEVKATTEPDQHDIDDLTGNDLEGQVEALLRIASDWRQVTGSDDKPLKFTRANVRLMLDHLPNAGRAIAEVLKGGTKNA